MDAHCHCGRQDFPPPQDYETIAAFHRAAGVDAAWMFPPVYEVYDRHDPCFTDTPEWQARRRRAHDYLLGLSREALAPRVVPFFFVWNDFDLARLMGERSAGGLAPLGTLETNPSSPGFGFLPEKPATMPGEEKMLIEPTAEPLGSIRCTQRGKTASAPRAQFSGIKWHRHPDEPVYNYDDPRCRAILAAIAERQLPVVLEEAFENTMRFLDELAPEAIVVVPHCGYLNGGFWRLHKLGVWRRPNVYADSSAAPSHDPGVLREFLGAYGPEKLLYGSDYPFDNPSFCLEAIRALGLPPADEALIVAGNALRLAGPAPAANGA